MRFRLLILLTSLLATFACSCVQAQTQSLSGQPRATVETSVRAFMLNVAHDITNNGPTDWDKYFADDPAFFMAVNGQMAFADRQAARQGIANLPSIIKKIELRWGDDLRVDPLTENLAVVATSYHELQTNPQGRQTPDDGFFTAVVEFRNGRWQFRNVHWSDPLPPSK